MTDGESMKTDKKPKPTPGPWEAIRNDSGLSEEGRYLILGVKRLQDYSAWVRTAIAKASGEGA